MEYQSLGEERDNQIGQNHFKFIELKIASRELFAATPLDGAGGLYFFNAEKHTKDSVLNLLEKDESIKVKMFIPEVHKLYVPKNTMTFTYKQLFDIENRKSQ